MNNNSKIHTTKNPYYFSCKLKICRTRSSYKTTHEVVNGMLKSIKTKSGKFDGYLQFKITNQVSFKSKFKIGQPMLVDLAFFQSTITQINAWLDAFHSYLQNTQSGFKVIECSKIEQIFVNVILNNNQTDSSFNSAELYFETPLPFYRSKSSTQTHLDKTLFFKQLQKRIKTLLGLELALPDMAKFNIQHWYWHYDEIRHHSKSEPGNKEYFNGCRGSLYIYGDLHEILPWLNLATVTAAGGKLALNFMGVCQLYMPARPRFDNQLTNPSFWKSMHEDLLEDNDQWASRVYAEHGSDHFGDEFYLGLAAEISEEKYQTQIAHTFTIQKQCGKRLIEQYSLKDHLVMHGLHHIIHSYANVIFEPSSHGFRSGYSVKTATEAVYNAIRQGYEYVLETDIQDFFPNVQHETMLNLCNHFLPPTDHKTRHLISRVIQIPYTVGQQLIPRQKGLPTGSPISPMLANLYLDQFDEQVSEDNQVKLIRYADDLLVLCKTENDAGQILLKISQYLEPLGLTLHPEKTAIKHISEGFQFLGQNFDTQLQSDLPNPPLKKTVYITEDNIWLGHNGDALQLKKSDNLIELIPFRKISDIIILSRSGISTGVLQKCAKFLIPVTLTLDDGYHINTIMPDSRHFFAISQKQSAQYYQSSYQDRLSLAKQFAAQKILNYLPVIRTRYQKGNHELITSLQQYAEKIHQAQNFESIRGLEGSAARLWFQEFNRRLKKPEFNFKHRKRDANDPMNGLFNFGYYLLFTRLNAMIRSAGLNPYLGYLHDGDDSYETFVCDIEELFRAHVDHMLLNIVNLGIISSKDFQDKTNQHGQVRLRLNRKSVHKMLIQFEKMLHTKHGQHTLLEIIQMQIKSFTEYFTNQKPIWIYKNEVNIQHE